MSFPEEGTQSLRQSAEELYNIGLSRLIAQNERC